jgi:polysaccharide export outer membrane protein
VRPARAFQLPIIAAVVALVLSGCMHAEAPLSIGQSPGDLDSFAYGTIHAAPRPAVADVRGGGGAIGALRNAFAAAPQSYSPPLSPVAYAAAPIPAPARHDPGYRLDAGDKLRVVVYGQEGLTNTYAIDAGGTITMPLIGQVPARRRTPAALAAEIAARLRRGYIREPSVAVEIEAYRPFFILGEVTQPGQYPYVANMTVEAAVAIAGGFSPRANKSKVELTRNGQGQQIHGQVPLNYSLRPGDTVVVKERWF